MNTIGETIATLRKRQRMTQEALANLIGVSPQSVSKWEGSINMPDISLLPVLADIFQCRIDDLFGRGGTAKKGNPDKVLDRCCDTVVEEIGACMFGDASQWEEFNKAMTDYRRKLKEDDSRRSTVICAHGIVYYREKMGAFILKRPQEGWQRLLEQESLDEFFSLAGDRDFRKALAEICRNRLTSFTLRSLCSRCGIQEEAALEEKLKKSRLFEVKTVDVDDSQISIYELVQIGRLSLLLIVFGYATEYAEFKDHYACFFGCSAEGLLE